MRFLVTPLLALAAGCTAGITGNEGNFRFTYFTDDNFDFNKPIAVGAKLDLFVTAVADNRAVELTAASTDDEAVLSVDGFAGNKLTLAGVGDGGALVSVSGTTTAGTALSDSVNMLARVPEALALSNTCSEHARAGYLSGSTVLVPFELLMNNGQPVIGYGYYPVDVAGPATLDATAVDQTWLHLDITGAGDITLTSQIDSTTWSALGVTADQIDGIEQPIPYVIEDIDAGDTNAFYVRPMVGEVAICQADLAKTVASLTPEICTVEDSDPESGSQEYGWFTITGVAQGTCEYTVTFGAVTETFEYPIQP